MKERNCTHVESSESMQGANAPFHQDQLTQLRVITFGGGLVSAGVNQPRQPNQEEQQAAKKKQVKIKHDCSTSAAMVL